MPHDLRRVGKATGVSALQSVPWSAEEQACLDPPASCLGSDPVKCALEVKPRWVPEPSVGPGQPTSGDRRFGRNHPQERSPQSTDGVNTKHGHYFKIFRANGRGRQRMGWLDSITTNSMDMNLSKLRETVKDREA